MERTAMIIVDGLPWEDGDGNDTWPLWDADALAEVIERQGYDDITIVNLDS